METCIASLCQSLPSLDRGQREFLLGAAQALAWSRDTHQREERDMQQEKMVYHGGKRTQPARVHIQLDKEEGSDRFCQVMQASSTAAAMDALEALVRGYEAWLGVPAHHVLAVLATVMTVPGGGSMER